MHILGLRVATFIEVSLTVTLCAFLVSPFRIMCVKLSGKHFVGVVCYNRTILVVFDFIMLTGTTPHINIMVKLAIN